MEKHYFAGGNTLNGFINLYNNIAGKHDRNRLYIIKGGSGVGKSTLLRKVAKEFIDRDYLVEYYHCTSDISSLDGICIPQFKIAMVDGTNPHIIEPSLVNITDFTIDLSKYIDISQVINKREQVTRILDDKANCFKLAYESIATLGTLYLSNARIIANNINRNKMTELTDTILSKIDYSSLYTDSPRQLFEGAITADGEVYLENTLANEKVIYLSGNQQVSSILLAEIYEQLKYKNAIKEVRYSPISTSSIYGLTIGDTILTVNPNTTTVQSINYIELSTNKMLTTLNSNDKLAFEYNCTMQEILMNHICEFLTLAQKQHQLIELVYTPAVNFAPINYLTNELIQDLLSTYIK